MLNKNGLIIALFILLTTILMIGYGFGVKAQYLPFTEELGFNASQLQFIRGWLLLAWVAGILLPILLLIQSWKQPAARLFWCGYLLTLVIQIFSEGLLSRQLVPSVVVPIGFFYTVFRLWQLVDGFGQLALSSLPLVAFRVVVLFWAANLVMLLLVSWPTVFTGFKSS